MVDRPWDKAEVITRTLDRSGAFGDVSTHGSGVATITVDFRITVARPWETRRQMRSSIAVMSEGVFAISLRMPEAAPDESTYTSEKILEAASEAAVEQTALPEQTNVRLRGGSDAWSPHIEWNGLPGSWMYDYSDGEEHYLSASQVSRLAGTVVETYRDEVGDRQ